MKFEKNKIFYRVFFLVLLIWFIWGISERGFFIGYAINNIKDTRCEDIQEFIAGGEISNGTDKGKIYNVQNSKEISRSIKELVCVGDLEWSGVSGAKLRMVLSANGGLNPKWNNSGYRMLKKVIPKTDLLMNIIIF